MRTKILICYSCLAWVFLTMLYPGKAHAQNYNMGNSSVSTCGGNFYDSGGPGGNYGNNQNYTMTICSNTPGTCVRVTFTSFDIENGYDFLYIYNGPNTASPLIGTYTGTNSPNIITGTSGCLTFRFTSDIIFTNPGWTATISCVTCSAGGGCSSTCSGGPAPANDACANAQNLGALPAPAACPNGVGAWANFNTTNLCATAESPYTSMLGCQPSGNMASPASDVWYRFTITGPTLNVSITGGLITPNVGLYAGTVCNNLIPRGCAIGAGGILNTSFGGLAPGTYYLQVSGGSLNDQCDFTLSLQNNYDCAGCVIQSNLTVSPAPINGTYQAGQAVTFCYTISDYNQTSVNWLHAVIPTFGPGWNLSSLTTVPANSCDGQGYWAYYNQTFTSSATGLVTGPGFFYQTPLGDFDGIYPDANCGDNFGDNNPLNLCDWTFCFTISTMPPGQCVQGASLNITIDTYGDGESGSWTSFACSGDPVTNFFATLACCEPPVVNTTNVTCPGLTNGSAIGTGQGTGPWNYIWQTAGGATIQSANNVNGSNSINNLPAGNYQLTVIDNAGCAATANFTITQPNPILPNQSVVNVNCNGGNNGSISLNPSGGAGGYSYQWSPAIGNNATVNNLSAGNYTVTITDANGCTTSATINIAQPAAISFNSNVVNSTCAGNTGSITINANGGTGALQYSINGGSTFQAGNVFNNLGSGSYNVVVQDANGCQSTAIVNVSAATAPVINSAPSVNVACNGGNSGSITINASGGTGALQYSINAGTTFQAGNVFNGLGAGNYSIVVQDANGCSVTTNVNITQPNPIVVIPNSANSTCGNSNGSINITANGGTGALQYSINGGSTYQAGNFFNGLAAGNYNIVVQDANGCTSASTMAVGSEPSPVIVSTPSSNVSCNGGNNGNITINANGGTGTILYSIDNGTTLVAGNVFNNLSAGTYNILIQDGNGCTATASVNITEPPAINVNANSVTSTCGNSNGSITVNANGGTGLIQYSINGGTTYQAGNVFNGLAAGNYSIVVQDANGCTATSAITVADATGPALASVPFTNVICFGGNTGSITINANGGTGALQYSINGGTTYQGGISFNNLTAGTYNIVVQDANGCTVTTTVNVTEPPQIVFNTNQQNTTCSNSNGSITINANGGTGILQYSINGGVNFQASNVFNGNAAGSYTVVVQDANGCTATSTISITDAPSPIINAAPATNVSCNAGSNGSITVNASGGTGALQYSINGGTTFQPSNTFNGLTAGNYTVVVQDANGCTVSLPVNITEPSALSANAITTTETCGSANGTITINANGGTGAIQYSINNGATYQAGNVFNGVPGGNYNIVVMDANGCTAAIIANVAAEPSPVITSVPVVNVLCNGGNNGSITIISNGGTGAIQYSINGGAYQTSNTFNGLTAGNYSVTIQDANGCTATSNAVITEPAALVLNPNTITATCSNSNGSITINANGGTGTIQYSINGGTSYQASNTFSGLVSGNYSVMIQDANGCTASAIVNVPDAAGPVITSSTVVNILCNGGNNGSLTINSNGGTGAVQYSLNGGAFQASNTFNGLTAGNYSITIQDANGCTATSNAVITEPAALVLNPNAVSSTCSNSNGSITINANGGTGTIQYSINGGTTYQASNTFSGLASGNYSVMIQDANGCTSSSNINVPDQPSPSITSTPVVNVICNSGNNGSITVNSNGGTGTIQYSINAGAFQSSNTFNGLTAGNYSITIQDANGCTATANATITEPSAIVFNTNTVTATCGASNGSITINANGGTGALQFSIDGGATFQSGNVFSGISAGNYNIVVTDANNCTVAGIASVSNALSPAIASAPVADVTCNSGTNGSITINAGGGTGALQYSINNGATYQAGNVFNNLIAGTYNIVVMDANGCSTTSVAIINEPSAINANATATVSTCGNSNGTITITGNGGTGTLQYSINGGSSYQSSGNFSGLASGNYSIVIQDANGCTAALNAVVGSEPSPLISSVPVVNASCNGANNGSITINHNGGTGTIQFSIDGGVTYQSSSTFSNLPAGTYNIIIQDGNGCTATTTATITQPSPINVNTITTDASCGNSDGTISVLANGGTGALQYSINGGTTWQGNIQFNNLLPGNYSITVQDANGCTTSVTATVNNAAAPAIVSSALTDVSCNGGNDGTITINASGGTGTLQYSINNGVTWQLGNVFSNLPTGNYSILVQDANGCQAAASITVSEPAPLVLNLNSVSSTCSNSNGEITVTANGGTGTIQFNINNGTTWQGGNTFGNLISGNYTILIQDGNGCTASSNITVADEPSPLISSVITVNLTCNNSNNGAITINHSGGTGAVQFSVDGGVTYQSSNSFTNLPAGNYSIIITDANGCSASSAVTITQPSAIVINTNMIQSTCGSSNGGITITANGGNGNYQYSINNGSTYQPGNMFSGLAAGNYAVVVMDGSGCTAALQTSVTDAASPQINSTPLVNAACFGQNNGSITINASGGTGALQYSINGGLTFHPGNNFNALAAGTYNIVVTDANGCSAASQVIITQPPQINVSSSTVSSSCGNNDGSITISANGGTGVLQYSINGGNTFQAGNTFSSLGAGNYNIVVMDGSGCTVQTVASVSNLNGPVISSTSTTDLTCYGSNDGALTITAGGGTGTLTYSINNGLTFQPVNAYANLAGGTYNIVVMDGNNCVATLSVIINEPSPIIFDALTTTETCGNSNGSITIIANGGTGNLVYSNNNGSSYQPGGLFNNLPSGNYTVVVQDANGCTAAALAVVNNEPSPVISSVTPFNVSCNGGTNGVLTIITNGGTGTILYSIDGGVTFYPSGTFNNLPAGNYSIIIEDGNGCTATSSAVVSEPAALMVNASSLTATCSYSNGSITVNANGGTGAIQYSLNGGAFQSGNTFNGLLSGNYSITVQDANGCTATSSTFVSNAASPVVASVTPSNVSCNGGTNGTIVIVSNGGTGAIQYSIDGGANYQSSNTFNNLSSGNYSIIIQDGNGCTATSSAVISQPAALSISGSSNPASCGNADGSVLISANGGTGTFQYSINGSPWQSGNFFNNLPAGNYTITVQDANGCTSSSITSVVNTAAPVIVSVNNTTVSCNGGNDGSISITTNGGTGLLLFSIDNGVTFQLANSFTNLPAGNYSIIVQDALGCQAASAITISEPSAVVLNTTSTIATCGNNNGTISISANGGTGTLLFSIDGGATFVTNPQFINLAPGNYSIIVSDANNCSASSSITVTDAPSPVITSLTENNITCFGLNNGAVTVNATGGSGTLLYSINGGAYQSSNIFSNLGTGNFSITVMDTNGCIVNAAALITQPAALVINSIPSNVDCFGGNTGSINLNVAGGTTPYSFLWSNNATSQNISNISSGNYSVTVTDGNGCTSTYTVTISEPAALVSVPVSTNILCHGGNTGAASVVISGGTQPYIYQWSNGNNGTAINNIIAGSYTVTVTDANNCTLIQSFNITEPSAISASAVSNAVDCFGGNNGSVTVNPSGGVTPYSYQWSPQGGSNQTAIGLTAGTYTCLITDANGCTYTYTDSVASPAQLVVNTQPVSVSCFGGNNGSITSTVSGGTLPYNYLWSNGSTAQNISGLASGTYTVTVTDDNGCNSYQSAIITQPAQLVMTVAGSSTICISQPAIISANANGGTPPYSYQWSNGVNTSSQTVSPVSTTVYSVSITDANGCTAASQSVTITVNPPLSVVAMPVNPICEGHSTVISAVASGGNGGPYTYIWSNNAGSSTTTVSPITTTTYTVTVTDNCGTPFAMANVTVTVNPLPVVQFTLDPPEGCIPLTVSFINNTITSNGSSYSWNFGDSSSDTLHSPIHTYYEPGTYTISLTVTTPFGCISALTMPNAVKAYPLPVADFLSNPEKASILNPRIQFKDLSIGASYWLWDFGDNYGTSNQQHPEYTYTAQGIYPVILIVENQYGCADTAYGKVIITGDYTLWVPNAFSPNQDGNNEHFTAYGIGIENFEMSVFNRWGDIVFHTNSLTPGWNGLNMKDNTECKQDVYIYLIKITDLNGEKHEVSGRVTLVR